jgi:hypothetical protein
MRNLLSTIFHPVKFASSTAPNNGHLLEAVAELIAFEDLINHCHDLIAKP